MSWNVLKMDVFRNGRYFFWTLPLFVALITPGAGRLDEKQDSQSISVIGMYIYYLSYFLYERYRYQLTIYIIAVQGRLSSVKILLLKSVIYRNMCSESSLVPLYGAKSRHLSARAFRYRWRPRYPYMRWYVHWPLYQFTWFWKTLSNQPKYFTSIGIIWH